MKIRCALPWRGLRRKGNASHHMTASGREFSTSGQSRFSIFCEDGEAVICGEWPQNVGEFIDQLVRVREAALIQGEASGLSIAKAELRSWLKIPGKETP